MIPVLPNKRLLAVTIAYFVSASLAIIFTRSHGGFAILWLATPVMTAALAVIPRREWKAIILACTLASISATSLFGLGWQVALPLGIVNSTEAVIGAYLLKRLRTTNSPLDSLSWVARFCIVLGVAAPVVGAIFGAMTVSLAHGRDFFQGIATWYVGHALGNLTFTPLILFILRGNFANWHRSLTTARRSEVAMLLVILVATVAATFSQPDLPLLFVPIMPLMFIAFRHDRVVAAFSVVLIAIVGGGLIFADLGPIRQVDGNLAARLQFFQFYLAATVLTILPVTAELQRRKKLLRSLRTSEARYRLLAEHSNDILLHVDPAGRILYASPAISRLAGYDPSSMHRRHAIEFIASDYVDVVREGYRNVLAAKGETVRFEYQAMTMDGELRWFESVARAVLDENGKVESSVSVLRDIEERKHRETGWVREASTDALTALPNRRAFFDALEMEHRNRRKSCVAVVDIDHFKRINDDYGHAAGDCALQTFAEVARRVIRKDDLVGRIGGEEFGILFRGLPATEAQRICERLRSEIGAALTFHSDRCIRFTISAGVADLSAAGPDATMACADEALYIAKRDGRDRLQLAA